jgi:hypothetical protein
MNIPIRMIGIATTIFWAFLIIFSISAAYSVKDIQFDFGDPQMSITPDNRIIFSLPIHILNKGLYNLGYFNVTTDISNANGSLIAHGSTFVQTVRKGERVTVYHNVTLDTSDMLQSSSYLFNDSQLNIAETVGMRLAELIPVQASGNLSYSWGAPLSNFALGTPAYEPYNLTHAKVTVPISFENHAFFDIAGDLQISMFNGQNLPLAAGTTTINAPPHVPYAGSIELYVIMTPSATTSGYFELTLHTQYFDYGPWVIPYG